MHAMTKIKNVLVIVLLLLILGCIDYPEPDTLPEDMVYEEPVQHSFTGDTIQKRVGDYTFTIVPVATYKIRALVICKKYYNVDAVDKLTPVDLCIVWGDMAESANIQYFRCAQRDRGCFITAEDSPLNEWYVETHFSNIHIIPADNSILEVINTIKVNQAVYLEGFLVNVYSSGVTIWETSLTQEDTGDDSCEVLYVIDLKV
jgi:hypothetical protein